MNWNPFSYRRPVAPVELPLRDLPLEVEGNLRVALVAMEDERNALEDTNNRRSVRMHRQLKTKDLQSPETRVEELLAAERKLLAITRIISGAAADEGVALLRDLGNRLGMGDPTVERIQGRMDALQSLAPRRDQIRTALAGIDWKEDVSFDFEEDAEAVKSALKLLQ